MKLINYVKYQLLGTIKKVKLLVTDVLGVEHTTYREGNFDEVRRYSSDREKHYYAQFHPHFPYIKKQAMETGFTVAEGKHVRVARIELLDTTEVPCELVLDYEYFMWNKHRVYCEKGSIIAIKEVK